MGKQANCQVAVGARSVTNVASLPRHWRPFVLEEWCSGAERRRRCQVSDEVGRPERWRLAPDALDELAG
ncbi:transposase [Streptomyces sp. NPDC058642]|uniref:transposase n=1 Tax=Streptomyces sp. NPDC058642 TaxID=3346572 RepID=UPI003665BE76